ncbi:hypothetical protein EP7_000406 [Isosphaeraceae bacterium EP7]
MGKLDVSQKRIEANRLNALKSTGPKTVEGKDKSRRNSLLHGLAGNGVVLPADETKAACERAEQWMSSLRPANAFELGLVETIAVESVRIERCRIEERLARDFRARRAVDCWGDERQAEIEKLARGLSSRPAETAARLRTTAPGCDWMIDRWRMLGHALAKNGSWTDEQAGLALDLLGVAAELRELPTQIDPHDGCEVAIHRRALVEDQLVRLHARKESTLDEIEDDHREAASQGLITVDDPTLVLLRRYETASLRRLKWALDLMHRGDKTRPDDHGFGKRDFDPPAWKGPNPAAVPNFPTPRPMPTTPAPGAERSHLAESGVPTPTLQARLSDSLPRAVGASQPVASGRTFVAHQGHTALNRRARRAARAGAGLVASCVG